MPTENKKCGSKHDVLLSKGVHKFQLYIFYGTFKLCCSNVYLLFQFHQLKYCDMRNILAATTADGTELLPDLPDVPTQQYTIQANLEP